MLNRMIVHRHARRALAGGWLLVVVGCQGARAPDAQQPSGQAETILTNGEDPGNPFFLSLGTNARTCSSCHDRSSGWTVTPMALQARFDESLGTDPIFRVVDAATSPNADVSTLEARRTAYDLLLTKGLIRVGRPIPVSAEFALTQASDPYGYASAGELSLFRRPLPSANLRFLTQVMWDGREPALEQQAIDATLGHAQAASVSPASVIAQIVAFEAAAYTAQRFDDVAGDLASGGATGGAEALLAQEFHLGVNDVAAPGFNRQVFSLFSAWANADGSTAQGQRRASIARGQNLFNTERIRINGVGGLADQQGSCSTCHDTPNVGAHSVAAPMNIGTSDDGRRPRGVPLYTLTNNADGRVVRTSDPGVALTTGRWADIGKFKVPVLRGVAMRPPYFHNGLADDLNDVVRFYIQRFGMRLSASEQADLVAFLSSL